MVVKASTPWYESFLIMQNTASLDFAYVRLASYSISLKQYMKGHRFYMRTFFKPLNNN